MTNRGPTPTQQPADRQPPDGVEVVTAAQIKADAKPTTLRQRLRGMVDGTLNNAETQEDVLSWLPSDDDQTIVTGNPAVAGNSDPGHLTEQTPSPRTMRELRKRNAAETERRIGRAAAKVAGLDGAGRWLALAAINFHHLTNFAELVGEGRDAFAERELPSAELRGRFRAELDEWERDIEAGAS